MMGVWAGLWSFVSRIVFRPALFRPAFFLIVCAAMLAVLLLNERLNGRSSFSLPAKRYGLLRSWAPRRSWLPRSLAISALLRPCVGHRALGSGLSSVWS